MQTATIHELKRELATLDEKKLVDLCLRLSKYKKDNKELLTYLLFEAHDENAYIESIKREIDLQFSEMNRSNLYYVKKSLRKTLRMANKFIRYSGIKTTAVEVLVYFCSELKNSGIPINKSKVLTNLYRAQLKKIESNINSLHEDLQYDYRLELEGLQLNL